MKTRKRGDRVRARSMTVLSAVLALSIFLLGAAIASSAQTCSSSGRAGLGTKMRALHMGGHWAGNIEGIKAMPPEYLQFLKDNHVEWLGISVAIFNESISDPVVKVKYRPQGDTSGYLFTFNDEDLMTFIARLKQEGIRVYLTLAFEDPLGAASVPRDSLCHTAQYPVNRWYFGAPTLYEWDDQCLNPSLWWWSPSHPSHATNLAIFWTTYTELAVKYATMAQQLGVDMFSLGTETDRLYRTRADGTAFPNHFKTELAQMVAAVRSVYSGTLTYDQHYSTLTHPEWLGSGAGQSYLFSDLGLDVVGVSAYFELTDSAPARVYSVTEFQEFWENIFKNYLVPHQSRYPNMPIIFLEWGYADSVQAPFMASSQEGELYVFQDDDTNGIDDGRDQQANNFEAFFSVNARYSDLVHGAFIWGNQIRDEWTKKHRGFGMADKPSEQVVRRAYSGWLRQWSLSVGKTGDGTGTVASNPPGIGCGTTCSACFSQGTYVTLAAVAGTGSAFTGWSGGGCSGTSACTVNLTGDVTVTAAFAAIPPCSYTISPPVKSFAYKSGTANITVTGKGAKGVSCAVSIAAPSDPSWIGAVSPVWKNNRGAVKVTVGTNTTSSGRSGSVAIADKTLAITQKGATCAITALTPPSQSVPVSGGSYSFNISVSPQDCAWTAASNKSWATLTSGSGTGDGTVAYTVPANGTRKSQTGAITVTLTKNAKKKTHTIKQTGR
jgi:hypothetical protein